MSDPVEANRRLWDARTPIHARSEFYDVDGFRRGRSSLHALERAELEEVGSLAGARVLHLMCHFGLDTLSMARDFAAREVVGVDFSGAAIAQARSLADECGLADVATFVEADVRDLDLDRADFDVVVVSYGGLCWLPELGGWAAAVARHLRPGGFAYVAELHPAANTINDEAGLTEMVVGYPYWTPESSPLRFLEPGTYADFDADITMDEYVWNHGLGDIVTSLIDAGLVLEFLREHPFTMYPQFPFLEERDDGWWHVPEGMPSFPLLFSMRARKPS